MEIMLFLVCAPAATSYFETCRGGSCSQHTLMGTSHAQIARLVKAQQRAVAEDRRAVLTEERENLEKLMLAISTGINRDLPMRIEDSVKCEVAAVTSSLGPAVQAALASTLPKELASGQLQVGVFLIPPAI